MSRLFVPASTQYLEAAQVLLTAPPFTISAWVRLDNDPLVDRTIFYIGPFVTNTDWFRLLIEGNTVADRRKVRMATSSGGTTGRAQTIGLVTLGAWQHVAGSSGASNSRSAYLNGGSKGTDATVKTPNPAAIQKTAIARSNTTSPAYWDGLLGHVAVWNVVLSDEEIANLANRFSPLNIQRNNLVAYWPLGGQSPERDVIGNLNLTLGNAPTQDLEPPIPQAMIAMG